MTLRRTLLLLWASLTLGNLWASDAEVRTGFLVNFARFTTWPESVLSATDPLRMCLAPGDAGMVSQWAELARQPIQGHSVQARLIARPGEVKDCHLLYLPAELTGPLKHWLSAAQQVRALIVGDMPGLVDAGGMIELALSGGRYRFDVNLVAASQADLHISSQLLKLARTVK
ncbi:YfiR family protein [Gammaproteobacteria bacterium]